MNTEVNFKDRVWDEINNAMNYYAAQDELERFRACLALRDRLFDEAETYNRLSNNNQMYQKGK